MLLQKKTTIEELIVRLLSLKSNLSVKEILGNPNFVNSGFSQRGIYKELKKLEENGIILKTKNKFNLDLSWIIEVSNLAENAYLTYSNLNYLEDTLNISDKKVTIKFTNLLRMDHYWIQVLIALHKILPNEPLFLWCPFQWFNLINNYNVFHFYSASEKLGAKRYHIMGANNYLNNRALIELPKTGKYSFEPGIFEKEMNTYYSLIGDYIIKITLDLNTTTKLKELFKTVQSEKALEAYNLKYIFFNSVKSKIHIEKNVLKANKLRLKFQNHFGLGI